MSLSATRRFREAAGWWLWTFYLADCIEQPHATRAAAARIFGVSLLAYPLPSTKTEAAG